MRLFVPAACALAVACLGATAVGGADNKLPEEARTVLEKAETLELLSLDPVPPKEKPADGFHGYKVLGKTTVKGDVRKELVGAFLKGMEGDIQPAKCFDPRHGIRATHDGKTFEVVICFECAQFKVYMGADGEGKGLLIGKGPEPAFDKVLRDAGIPKAK
jgi:hypothetical protein